VYPRKKQRYGKTDSEQDNNERDCPVRKVEPGGKIVDELE
jgi:hypothetical protein